MDQKVSTSGGASIAAQTSGLVWFALKRTVPGNDWKSRCFRIGIQRYMICKTPGNDCL